MDPFPDNPEQHDKPTSATVGKRAKSAGNVAYATAADPAERGSSGASVRASETSEHPHNWRMSYEEFARGNAELPSFNHETWLKLGNYKGVKAVSVRPSSPASAR